MKYFQAVVTIDLHGNSLHKEIKAASDKIANELLGFLLWFYLYLLYNVLRFSGAPNRLPSQAPPQELLGKLVTHPPAGRASHDGVAVESTTQLTHANETGVTATNAGYVFL